MINIKSKARYISPCLTGASAMLLDLICASVRFNVQVNPLENINAANEEPLYFEF